MTTTTQKLFDIQPTSPPIGGTLLKARGFFSHDYLCKKYQFSFFYMTMWVFYWSKPLREQQINSLSCLKFLQLHECSVATVVQFQLFVTPGSSVHGILQARTLEWVAMLSSRVSYLLRDWTHIFCIADGFFTTEPPEKPKFLHY